MEQQEILFFAVWNAKWNVTAILEDNLAIFHEGNIFLLYNPAIMILGFNWCENLYLHKTYTQMFIASFVQMNKDNNLDVLLYMNESFKQLHPHNRILFSNKKKWSMKLYKDKDKF